MNLDSFLKIFVPKDKSLFPIFEDSSSNLFAASGLLINLMKEDNEEKRNLLITQIKEIETKGDTFTHNIYDHVDSTFITPFDREDINKLASCIDDVLDNIYGTALKFGLFKPKKIMPHFLLLAETIEKCIVEVNIAVTGLKNAGANKKKILQACINLNTLENEGDDTYHNGISKLFDENYDAKDIIKNKAILETLEKTIDKAEDISDTIKSILIKMA